MGRLQKQFLLINKRPILEYSLDVFLRCPQISGIILTVPRGKVPFAKRFVRSRYPDAEIRVISGGTTRRDSSYRALSFIQKERGGCDYVVFHDGVRPTVSKEMVVSVIENARKYGAAVLGSMALNVIVQVEDGMVCNAFNATTVYNTQTPHCYRFDWIKDAHESRLNGGLEKKNHENIELVRAFGKPVKVIESFYQNMKLTFLQDIVPLSALLKRALRERDFFSFD